MSEARSAKGSPRVILGIAAIAAGVLLTLRNLGVAGIDDLLDYWPLALVALGLAMAFRPRGVPGRGVGSVIAVIGAWMVLKNLGLVSGDLWDLWPLFLVFAGGALVWHATRSRRSSKGGDSGEHLDPRRGGDPQLRAGMRQ